MIAHWIFILAVSYSYFLLDIIIIKASWCWTEIALWSFQFCKVNGCLILLPFFFKCIFLHIQNKIYKPHFYHLFLISLDYTTYIWAMNLTYFCLMPYLPGVSISLWCVILRQYRVCAPKSMAEMDSTCKRKLRMVQVLFM